MDFPLNFISAGKDFSEYNHHVPAPYMRRSFELSGEAQKGELLICGLGFYELFINGEHITKGFLAPYITNPDTDLLYDRYDIAPYLKKGKNVIGLILGNGMQNAPGGTIWDFQKAAWRSAPKVALRAEITCDNGEHVNIISDKAFKTHPSPIQFDDLRCGEYFDANEIIKGWNEPDYDDSDWANAIKAKRPRGKASECYADPIKISREIKAVEVRKSHITEPTGLHGALPVIEPPEDEAMREGWLYDFGVNSAGICRLKIKGKKGQKVVLQFCELEAEDGGLFLKPMNFEPERYNHRCIYTCSGEGVEEYVPSFSYFGYRYCIVLGIDDEQATPDLVTYLEMHSDLKKRGGFECSNADANALMECARISDLANFYYFPTDCPHREKNGWTGDAAASAEHMILIHECERSLKQWLQLIRNIQREDGALPGIIPTPGWGFHWGNGPAWDRVIFQLPYYIWVYRNDTTVITENTHAMMCYLDYVSKRADDKNLVHIGLGDWCQCGHEPGTPDSPLELTDTVMVIEMCEMAEKMFKAVGLNEQAAFASGLYRRFRNAVRCNLIDFSTMTAAGNCQTSQALCIYYNVFSEEEKEQAFKVLLDLIKAKDDHMDCGLLGLRVIFHVLSDNGYSDLAFKMITRRDYPSYGNLLARGATSLWEEIRPESDFPTSKNHHFFGDFSGWFISAIAGIKLNPNRNDVNEVEISPSFIGSLDKAEGWHIAPAGKIISEWQKENGKITLTVNVPVGIHGEIKLSGGYHFENGTTKKEIEAGKKNHIIIKQK